MQWSSNILSFLSVSSFKLVKKKRNTDLFAKMLKVLMHHYNMCYLQNFASCEKQKQMQNFKTHSFQTSLKVYFFLVYKQEISTII